MATKKKKTEPTKIKGKQCSDCGQKFEEPSGYEPWEMYDAYESVLHGDVSDCIRHLRAELDKQKHHSHTIFS